MKGNKTREKKASTRNIRISFRVNSMEKARLDTQARSDGQFLSDYLRKRLFGARPPSRYPYMPVIRELRKLGQMLQENFEIIRMSNAQESLFEKQEEVLQNVKWLIQKIGLKINDRQKNQEL